MAVEGGIDFSSMVSMVGNDELVNNERTRCTLRSVTVGGNTFPANPLGINYMSGIGTPTSTAPASGNSTALNIAALATGIIVLSPSAAAQTFTTDTAANIVQYMAANSAVCAVGDILTVLLINGGSNAFTVGFGTNVSKDANVSATWPAATSKPIYFRVTNATPGSETVTAYF